MSNIFLISDTHFNHNKPFLYEPRGFHSVQEMNETIINNWNNTIHPDDTVYLLGDVMLGNLEEGLRLIKSLNGHIRLAIGNHDTDVRLTAFKNIFEDIQFGYKLSFHNKVFLLTHYPTLTGNFDNSKTFSIHGHTHNKNIHQDKEEHQLMFNVSCEAINCTPIALESINDKCVFEKQWYENSYLIINGNFYHRNCFRKDENN